MTSHVPCRFHQQGNCAYGDQCRFSHGSSSGGSTQQSGAPSGAQVCRFFLQGNCSFGDKCRNSHATTAAAGSRAGPPHGGAARRPPLSAAAAAVRLPSNASEVGLVDSTPNWDDFMTPDEMDEFEAWQAEQEAGEQQQQPWGPDGAEDEGDIMDPADIPLCEEWASTGACSAGDSCCYIHGDECEICGYYCVHPYNPDVTAHHQLVCAEAMAAASGGGEGSAAPATNGKAAAAAEGGGDGADAGKGSSKAAAAASTAAADDLASKLADTHVCRRRVLHPTDAAAAARHADACSSRAARLAKAASDAALECGICYERVLAKPGGAGVRRFGLLACEHPFCLMCIRGWRATGEGDAKTALRTCPVCRTPAHFITPSSRWPDCPADKATIINGYKASLAQRDCALFEHGDGVCPFGTSCFYRHAYRDGRLEEVQLRRAGDADGGVKVIQPVTLSSFLEASLTAQLALSSSSRPRQQRQRGGQPSGGAAQEPTQQQQQEPEQQQQQQQGQQQEQQDPPEGQAGQAPPGAASAAPLTGQAAQLPDDLET